MNIGCLLVAFLVLLLIMAGAFFPAAQFVGWLILVFLGIVIIAIILSRTFNFAKNFLTLLLKPVGNALDRLFDAIGLLFGRTFNPVGQTMESLFRPIDSGLNILEQRIERVIGKNISPFIMGIITLTLLFGVFVLGLNFLVIIKNME